MSFQITEAFVQQYSSNVRMLAQQMTSRLRSTVTEENVTGEAAYMEQVAPVAARKRQARHEDSPLMNTQHLRRRVTVYDYEWGDLIDKPDRVRLLIDPTSTYAQAAASAMMRGYDDEILAGFFGTAYTGHTGNTAVVWPNGNPESVPAQPGGTVVGVANWDYGNGASNTGLTISKLISASVALDAGEGDENEERFMVLTAKAKGQLLSTTEATNVDYTTVQSLVEGKINKFCGFTFIHSERVQFDGNGYARLPAWKKTGMALGNGMDIWGRITERPDKSYSTYVYSAMSCGATRLEEVKVVEVKCQGA